MTAPSPSRWTPRRIIFLGIVGAIAVASVTVGVRMMNARVDEERTDSAQQRDTQRFDDLQHIADAVAEIARTDGRVPQTLEEVRQKASHPIRTGDPQTFEIYEYRVIDDVRAEVCARFEEAAAAHETGRSCFTVGAASPLPVTP